MQCAVHFLESGERLVYLGDEQRHLIGAAWTSRDRSLLWCVAALRQRQRRWRLSARSASTIDRLRHQLIWSTNSAGAHDVGVLVDQ